MGHTRITYERQSGYWRQQQAGEWVNRRAYKWKTVWLRIWELLEEVKENANGRWSTYGGWGAVTSSRNWCTECNSWQLSYHLGIALIAYFALTRMWTSAVCYITLLLFASRQSNNVRATLYWGAFVLTLVSLTVLGKRLNSDAITWICENLPLVGNVATLVVCENISLTINVLLSETVTELRAVVRTQ
jgi:hypothetical protein